MKLERHLRLPAWNDELAGRAASYLQSRGFSNARLSSSDGVLVVSGNRGSWLGNFTSFDMTQLLAKVRVAGIATGNVDVELNVNTFGQQITQWNIAVWRLELVELHHILTGRGPIDDVWNRFKKDARSAAVRWTFTAMFAGQRLSPEWDQEIRNLENALQARSDAG